MGGATITSIHYHCIPAHETYPTYPYPATIANLYYCTACTTALPSYTVVQVVVYTVLLSTGLLMHAVLFAMLPSTGHAVLFAMLPSTGLRRSASCCRLLLSRRAAGGSGRASWRGLHKSTGARRGLRRRPHPARFGLPWRTRAYRGYRIDIGPVRYVGLQGPGAHRQSLG